MDKKTLRRIIDNLKSDGLIETRVFQVSIKELNQVKTLLLKPGLKISDEDLMLVNATIANPTNKKIKQEQSSGDQSELIFKHHKSRVLRPHNHHQSSLSF